MNAAFGRMTTRLLARMGQESVLRQEIVDPPRLVSIAHGVQFTGYGSESASYRGDLVVSKSVATILKECAPRVGDRLVHPDGDYDLDVLHKDNGYTMQFVLREHAD